MNMNKKILIISIIVLVVVLALGFIVYKYIVSVPVEVQNVAGGAQVQNDASDQAKPDASNPQIKVEAGGVEVSPKNGGGTFNICLDKCGDGICQKTDPKCGEDINLGCVCLEASQDCPQDCK